MSPPRLSRRKAPTTDQFGVPWCFSWTHKFCWSNASMFPSGRIIVPLRWEITRSSKRSVSQLGHVSVFNCYQDNDSYRSLHRLGIPSHGCQGKFVGSARRYIGSTSNIDDHKESPPNNKDEPRLLYRAPMGGLVSRLKRVSITSCLISVIGLPMLIYLKNGGWPNAKQIGMGGFAFLSATGSTLALHFVFGPYVLDLYEIPVRKCQGSNENESSPGTFEQPGQEFLFKATTRSILGLTKEVVFNPLTDITRYQGARPFANFVVKNEFVLYCHPELLDDQTRLKLLSPKDIASSDEKESKEKGKIRRPVDEDDGFL